MKLIIDIPEDVYIRLKDNEHMIRDVVEKFGGTASTQANLAILDGTPYEERPKGKWINFQKSFLYGTIAQCSRCDNTLNMNGVNAGRSDANYCPNCGADMRGDV